MRSTTETDARSARSEFDELLVTLHDDSDDWRLVVLQFVGIASIVLGMIWFPVLVAVHVNSFVRSGPGAKDAAEATTKFGGAAGAPFGFITVGGLLISFVFLVKQRKSEQLARIHHEMPVVFMAPRLVWDLERINPNTGNIIPKKLNLCVAIRNVSDVAAVQVFVDIHDLSFDADRGKPASIPLRESEMRLDYLTKSEVGNETQPMLGYVILSEIPLDQCAELIDAIVRRDADAERPSLTMSCSVGFKTIHGALFRSTAKAIWSPKHCREVKSRDLRDGTKQRDLLDKLRQGPWDDYMLAGSIKPLSPKFS